MISFLVAAKAQDFQQTKADDYYLHGIEAALDQRNPWDRLTIWLNRASGGCFFAGVVLTTVFVATNLVRAQQMTEAKRSSTSDGLPAPQLLQKGLTAPTLTTKVPTQAPSAPVTVPATSPPATGGSNSK
jgi:hypothetical protein